MNKELEGTKTLQNLINTFAGESQAVNRYIIYSQIAKDEGYEQIAQVFLDTAGNEKEHAKLFFEKIDNLYQGYVKSSYPFETGKTLQNLDSAQRGEAEEYKITYLKGETDAKEEGFQDIALLYSYVRSVEKHHSERFGMLFDAIKENRTFSCNFETQWMCRKCGYILVSKSAPEKCPLCKHPKAYFEQLCEKY